MSANGERQQHWTPEEPLAIALAELAISGQRVLELGAGSGSLTRALLTAGAASIEAWEIDEAILPVRDDRVFWRVRDIGLVGAADIQGRLLAAIPPYSMLGLIESLVDGSGLTDALLMIPAKKLGRFVRLGFRVLSVLDGSAFDPPANGRHLLIAKGMLVF